MFRVTTADDPEFLTPDEEELRLLIERATSIYNLTCKDIDGRIADILAREYWRGFVKATPWEDFGMWWPGTGPDYPADLKNEED